jgi:hypothetical protein
MQDVPKIAQARLQRSTPPSAEAHPDADLLTAFAERSLAGRERDHVLEHLARCGDCREVVALALPATEAVALAGSRSPARIGWLSLPVLRWGVVAAGILAISSVGILQYRKSHQETLVATSRVSQDQSADSAAQNPAPTPQATARQEQENVPRTATEKRTTTEKRTETAKQAPAPSVAHSALAADNPAPAPNAIFPPAHATHQSTSARAFHGGKNTTSEVLAQQNPSPSASQRATAPSSASTAVEVSGASPQVTTQTTAQSQIQDQFIQNEAAEPQSSVDRVSRAKSAPAQSSPAMAPAPLLHADPTLMKASSAFRWTISASGALQRSFDGGKTWFDVDVAANNSAGANFMSRAQTEMVMVEAQSDAQSVTQSDQKMPAKNAEGKVAVKSGGPTPAARTIFRAVSVSSNAAEVWAGGSGGVLYHTLDAGNRWARIVPSQAGIVLSGDIIAIQFSDPRNGIVTTSTAEVWTTLDSGQTWHKQP